MFRQTVIRGAHRRELKAGATNLPGGTEVAITLDGDDASIDEMVETARKLQTLNSWGASIKTLTELESGGDIEEHQVTTENVDDFSWNPNVDMFL
jgi:acylphosphatase